MGVAKAKKVVKRHKWW